MALLNPGYWQFNYWPSGYWQQNYWLEYGLVQGVGIGEFGYRFLKLKTFITEPEGNFVYEKLSLKKVS